MVSVIVNWGGHCGDRALRDGLTARIRQLAGFSHALFEPPLRIEEKPPVLEGDIVVAPGLLAPADEGLLTLKALPIGGLDFRLFDARGLYPHEDTVSFLFADPPDRPDAAGALVQVVDKETCALYRDPRIQAADWLVERPSIHLRYYGEEWIDSLLGFVKRYYVPDLDYWRHEPMPGWRRWAGLDPADTVVRETRWEAVLAGLFEEARAWIPRGRELRARLDHMNRTGVMPASWAFAPMSPIVMRLAPDPAVARRFPGAEDRTALLREAGRQVIAARQGFDLFYLSFRFDGETIAISSQLRGDTDLLIRASLAPDDHLRVIPEGDARPLRKPRR